MFPSGLGDDHLFRTVQIGFRAHPVPSTPGVNGPAREAGSSPPSSAEVKNELSCTPTLTCRGVVQNYARDHLYSFLRGDNDDEKHK
jgi:hypothetical protein